MPKPTNHNPFTQVRANNRRARASGWLNVRHWKAALKAFDYACAYCGAPFSDQQHPTIDHVRSLARGGANNRANVVPACADCNHAKDSLALDDWLIAAFGADGAAAILARLQAYFTSFQGA